MNRRGFFKFMGGAAAVPIAAKLAPVINAPEAIEALPEIALSGKNTFLTIDDITKEALRLLQNNMAYGVEKEPANV